MSIIREKIKYVGTNMNLKFNLNSEDDFLGYQQEIDNLTQVVTTDLVNPPVDVEVRRFKYYAPNVTTSVNFAFTKNGTTYNNLFATLDFKVSDSNYINYVSNSFFIYELFDSYNVYNQTKIATTYVTKIGTIFNYTINPANQLYYLNVPVSYINTNLDLGITGITAYTKISFYNAKSGKIILFNNSTNINSTTPVKIFFYTVLDLVNNTWKFVNPTSQIIPKQIYAGTYSNRVNDTLTNFDKEVQSYPEGSKFNSATGLYEVQ